MKILLFVIITSLLLSSCIDENFEEVYDNFAVRTSWSVPIGYYDYILKTDDFSGDEATIPGIYGFNYFNGRRFAQNNPYYERNDNVNFTINVEKFIEKGVKSCILRVNVDSNYPTDIEVQISIEDKFGRIYSVFEDGPKLIIGAETDTSGNVLNSKHEMFDIPFGNRMDVLANAKRYIIQGKIFTYKQGLKYVKFTDASKANILLGVSVFIDVKTNEI